MKCGVIQMAGNFDLGGVVWFFEIKVEMADSRMSLPEIC
jgi:hypothetical protein